MTISLVVFGPKGCGKTRNAAELMKRHQLLEVVELDESNPLHGVKRHDVLYITCDDERARTFAANNGLRSMPYSIAIKSTTTR